ncbi:MAG: hypothetical protein QG673_1120 [Pseudomonadota bacterium]|nr:hypothetical protein [Pseudomonadota bacterium]
MGEKIPKNIIDKIEDLSNQVYYSMASLMEMAIKISIKKLDVDINQITNVLYDNEVTELRLEPKHLIFSTTLPFYAQHKDPFDRLLVSQTIVEKYYFCTCDSIIKDFYTNPDLLLLAF